MKHGLAAREDAGGDHAAETQRGGHKRQTGATLMRHPYLSWGDGDRLFPAVWWLAGDYYPLPLRRNRRSRIAFRPEVVSSPKRPCPSREARYLPRCLYLIFFCSLQFFILFIWEWWGVFTWLCRSREMLLIGQFGDRSANASKWFFFLSVIVSYCCLSQPSCW